MKKILSVIIILSVLLTSCLKDDTINTEGGLISTGTIIELPYTGLAYFGDKSVLTAGVTDDIVDDIVINIANSRGTLFSKDLTVTLGVDDAARVAYNATSDIKYEALPDSCYSFPVTTGVIPAGQQLDTLQITFFPEKIDPSKNYMLPIQLKDAEGQVISGNFSIAYYHTIGNPIAGNYTWSYSRWNNADGSGPVTPVVKTATFLPIDPSSVSVPGGYISLHYIMTFTNDAGVLSNFKAKVSQEDLDYMAANSIAILNGPNVLIADPLTGHYKIQMVVASSGAPRYVIDDYLKQ